MNHLQQLLFAPGEPLTHSPGSQCPGEATWTSQGVSPHVASDELVPMGDTQASQGEKPTPKMSLLVCMCVCVHMHGCTCMCAHTRVWGGQETPAKEGRAQSLLCVCVYICAPAGLCLVHSRASLLATTASMPLLPTTKAGGRPAAGAPQSVAIITPYPKGAPSTESCPEPTVSTRQFL